MLNTKILDAYDDSDLSIAKEIMGELPGNMKESFQKTAAGIDLLTEEQRDSLRNDQFSLVVLTKHGQLLRKFPASDPGQTWLSQQYFVKTAGEMPEMAQAICAVNLNHACNVWGVPLHPAITKVANLYQGIHSNFYHEADDPDARLPEPDYVEEAQLSKIARNPYAGDKSMWGLTNGGTLRYPLEKVAQVKVAAEYFEQNWKGFTPEERNEFATKIAANSIRCGLPHIADRPAITKYAGVTYGDRIGTNLAERIQRCVELDLPTEPYEELSKTGSAMPPVDMALALRAIDSQNRFERYYNKGTFDDPYAATFGNEQVKVAMWSMDVAGRTVTEDDLKKIPDNKIRSAFGDSFVVSFKKNPVTIFKSMPTPEKASIISMVPGNENADEEDIEE